MVEDDVKHIAYSYFQGTFDKESPGGCSCGLCTGLLKHMEEIAKGEAAKFYEERYGEHNARSKEIS